MKYKVLLYYLKIFNMHTSLHTDFNARLHTTGELSTWVAIASFVAGTALFAGYKLEMGNDNLVVFGFVYVCVAFLLNFLVLANLVVLFCTERKYRDYIAIKILIILANIPVTLLYLNFL